MKIEGDIQSAINRMENEWGTLQMQDGRLADATGQAVEGRYELVDTLSRELGVLATVFAGDAGDFTRIATSIRMDDGRRAVGTTLGRGSAAFAPVSAGERYVGNADILGAPYLTAYEPIQDAAGQVIGIIFLGIPREQINTIVQQGLNQMLSLLTVGVLVLMGLGVLVAVILARMISGPIEQVATTLKDIAQGEGDLTRRLAEGGKNELGDLAQAFNAFVDRIHQMVKQIAGASTQVATAAEQLSATTEETQGQVRRQHSETDQVATAMNEMTATVQEVARNASDAAHAAASTHEEAEAGRSVVRLTVESIEGLAGEVERAAQVINSLSEDSESIGRVLEVIRGVAEQTNLLALNAAIEAARAGEQGRGFAVVADEVRTLATRTQDSTKEIQEMIERLQGNAASAVQVMKESRGRAQQSVSHAGKAGTSLEAITGSIGNINDMNTQIASAAEEQSSVSEEINRNISNIAQSVDQTASGAGQIAGASDELARLAAELQVLVGRFKV
jgi:methyl-accepting chemotaxis protein